MDVYFGLTPQDLGLNKNLTAYTSLFNLKSRQVLGPLINSKKSNIAHLETWNSYHGRMLPM